MAEQGGGDSGSIVIGGRYRVEPGQPRDGFCGLASCTVEHASTIADQANVPSLVAVRARRDAPPPASLQNYVHVYSPGLLMPVAHGVGGGSHWIVCDAPPGPSLLQAPLPAPVGEAELVNAFLKPLAQALSRLHAAGLTHRGVRPANLFRLESGRVLLGPGCLGPHAFDQPALYEPAASGLCAPSCRGVGTAADDAYALGVVLVELLAGQRLLRDMTEAQIVQRKLEIGSYQLLVADQRVPPSLVSLLRSMLSDDPLARPALSGLAENGVAAERPKPPRPDARAPRPLMLGRTPIYTARMLAQAFARQPAEALGLLRAGTVDQWLRRALEQSAIAVRIEETLRTGRDRTYEGSDPMLLMQVIAMLDPLAPMFWQGMWLWPDAIPAMLARAMVEGGDTTPIVEMLQIRALRRWCFLSGRVMPNATEEIERRNARMAELAGSSLRLPALAYALNPFLPCVSPTLDHACVLAPDQLLAALELQDHQGSSTDRVLDPQMLALLAGRAGGDNAPPISSDTEGDGVLLDLSLLSWAQRHHGQTGATAEPAFYPRLASRLLPGARERLRSWPGKGRRGRRIEQLEQVAAAGDLAAMLALIEQGDARSIDEQALREARGQVETLRAAHLASADASEERARLAGIGGQDLAIAAGMLGLLIAVVTELVL